MQPKPADSQQTTASANQNIERDEIDSRLVDVIKANLSAPQKPATERPRLQTAGYLQGAKALLGLSGLLIAAYIYALLVKKEA